MRCSGRVAPTLAARQLRCGSRTRSEGRRPPHEGFREPPPFRGRQNLPQVLCRLTGAGGSVNRRSACRAIIESV